MVIAANIFWWYGITVSQKKQSLDIRRLLQIVCQEVAQEMRVWSLGAGLQEQAPKHPKLRRLRAGVVSVGEKVPRDGISCESERRAQANH
jgi:hypothetical protein